MMMAYADTTLDTVQRKLNTLQMIEDWLRGEEDMAEEGFKLQGDQREIDRIRGSLS